MNWLIREKMFTCFLVLIVPGVRMSPDE